MIFHWYGFLVGVGVVTCILTVEFALKKWSSHTKRTSKNEQELLAYFWRLLLVVLLFAVVGARIWHGVTDFHLYRTNIVDLLWINQGGLSILGAVFGGILGIISFQWFQKSKAKKTTLFWIDACVLGVVFGQMIGRIGNWVNQELYGLPSDLPWAISIHEVNRVTGYEQFATYHPLFLYEIILLAPLSFILWRVFLKDPSKLGTGFFIALYGVWYGLGRVLLEFIRVDKATVFGLNLGINQIILLLVAVFSAFYLFTKRNLKTKQDTHDKQAF